ncbi:hypothetical protein Nmel_009947 [Mimus melanotis]
MKSAQKTWII